MKEIIIILSDEEEKALATEWKDVSMELNIMAHDVARRVMRKIIAERTALDPTKLTGKQRDEILRPMTLESAVDRIAREKEEMDGLDTN